MLASSSRSCVGPTGLRQNISAGDGGKRARSPRRARHKPLKPLRAGTSGDSGVLVYSCAFLPMQSAREAAGATGTRRSPRPLSGGRFINASGALRGEGVNVCLDVIASEAKQSISPRKGRMDCFASLAMTCSCDHRATLSGRHHPRRRVIQYSGTLAMETRSCGVLDTPRSRSMTVFASSP